MEKSTDKLNKKGLGRGVGALFGGSNSANNLDVNEPIAQAKTQSKLDTHGRFVTSQEVATQKTVVVEKIVEKLIEQKIDEDKRIWFIAIDKLVPGQYQPRKSFDKTTLEELAISIKENGILQPLVIRKRAAGGFEIIAGERRWRAAQLAGLHEVPAIIKNYSDQEALQVALIENIQREDLDPIEEAESYQRLIEEFNLSQQQAAEKVGKERSSVANALRLLALPNEIKNMLAAKEISVGHAKVLLSIDNRGEQMRLAKLAREKSLSVRALEQALKSNKQATQSKAEDVASAESIEMDMPTKLAQQLAAQMQKKLGTKTTIVYKKGKGEITIHFYSDDQLNSIYERLTE